MTRYPNENGSDHHYRYADPSADDTIHYQGEPYAVPPVRRRRKPRQESTASRILRVGASGLLFAIRLIYRLLRLVTAGLLAGGKWFFHAVSARRSAGSALIMQGPARHKGKTSAPPEESFAASASTEESAFSFLLEERWQKVKFGSPARASARPGAQVQASRQRGKGKDERQPRNTSIRPNARAHGLGSARERDLESARERDLGSARERDLGNDRSRAGSVRSSSLMGIILTRVVILAIPLLLVGSGVYLLANSPEAAAQTSQPTQVALGSLARSTATPASQRTLNSPPLVQPSTPAPGVAVPGENYSQGETATSTCFPNGPYSEALGDMVEAELAGQKGQYGVAIINPRTGEAYLHNGDTRLPSASVYKLAVFFEAYRQMASGALSPDTKVTITRSDALEPEPAGGPALGAKITVAQALDKMITISSNVSARALLRTLGRDAVNNSVRSLGLINTIVPTPDLSTGLFDRDGDDIAVTSARDMGCYMSLLSRGGLVDKNTSIKMRDLLLRQKINDRLPALLPDEARVAHKTGELANVRNDVGIVYGAKETWVIAIMSKGVDAGTANLVIANISRGVYDYFER